MNFPSVPERLLTWLDVERVFKRETALWSQLPSGVHAIRCYSDGAEIEHSAALADVQAWLKEVFGRAWKPEESGIQLRTGATPYPVVLSHVLATAAAAPAVRPYPLWREVTYLPDLTDRPLSDDSLAQLGMPALWADGHVWCPSIRSRAGWAAPRP